MADKYRTVDIDGETVTIDKADARHIARAVELFVTVSNMEVGAMDFPYWESFRKEQTALLLSLETGISETHLKGAVDIAYKIYKGENLTWTRWDNEHPESRMRWS